MYVQIMLMENIKHVSFAKQVLCVSELRHSLLATSAQCLGVSALLAAVSSFGHTSSFGESDMNDITNAYEAAVSNEYFEVRSGGSGVSGLVYLEKE